MKRSVFLSLAVLLALGYGCKNSKSTTETKTVEESQTHTEEAQESIERIANSQQRVSWPGRYTGILPCADCEGIEVSLAIQEDGAYYRTLVYQGKDMEPIQERGKFQWNTSGSFIRLQLPNSLVQWYEVGDGLLFHLDQKGARIRGDLSERYILYKEHADPEFEGVQWILYEINSKPVADFGTVRKPNLMLDGVRKRISGNDGCNSFSGRYEIQKDGSIGIGPLASTEMFCEGDRFSEPFYKVLNQIDRYHIKMGVLTLSGPDGASLKYRKSQEE